ncbi:DMT family transporter [Clostridium sp. CS001]|uniref:DMT family transporter n=1 Tax=Clostridium sp. CS001 TaxID=2880648 RepID=UPI001CF435B2|nr:DMT family transporter [Clostridium sp. CS001]MCB2291389.1 DMT family transporter [Clostridium sp. CS001]
MNNNKIFTDKRFVACIATLCCLLWGSAYPAVKSGYILFNIGSADVSSKIVFAGYRFTLAGLLVLILAKAFRQKLFAFTKKNFLNLVILGITQTTLQYIFFYIGLSNTTGVKGSIMNSMGTFFSVFLAHYIYNNDKLSLRKITGCIVGFVGVMIVNFNADLLNFSLNFKGEGFVIISSFMFSVAAIYGKKLTQSMDVMVVTGYSLFLGGVLLTFLGMGFGGSVTNFTLSSTLLLSYLILLSSVAFTLWSLLLKHNKVGSVSVFIFLTPIFGAILSAIFLGENILEVKNVFALLLVCFGIWMVNKDKSITIK